MVYQGRQHDRENQRPKRNLIRPLQHNAVWLLEHMGCGVHSHTAARVRGRPWAMHVQTELKSRRNDHFSADAGQGAPTALPWCTLLLLPHIHGLGNYTFDSCLPLQTEHPKARAGPILFILYTQPLINQRGSVKFFSLSSCETQEPTKRTAMVFPPWLSS